MPQDSPSGRDFRDAARLSRSFAAIFQIVSEAAQSAADVFCAGHQVGFKTQSANPYLYVRDVSATDCVAYCYACDKLWQAPYAVAADSTVSFGKATVVEERFVPVEGEAIADAISLEDADVEILDSGGPIKRLRLLGTKANTVINRRVYPAAVLREAVSKLKPLARAGQVYSESPHPKPIRKDGKVIGFESNPQRRVSRVSDIEMNDRGEVWVTHEFMDTPLAQKIFAAFEARTREYGSSTRAIGQYEERAVAEGRQVPVAKMMHLHTFDFVPNPALADTLGKFEVLLDAQLGEPPDTPALPLTPEAEAAGGAPLTDAGTPASKEDGNPMPENTTPAGQTPAQPTPAPAAAPAVGLTPDHIKVLESAQRIIEADEQRRTEEAQRQDVASFVASPEVTQSVGGFPEDLRAGIVARVAAAPNRAEAERTLAAEMDSTSRIMAAAKLAAQGYGQPAAGQGATIPTAGQTDIQVIGNPTPHLEVARKFQEAYDAFQTRTSGSAPDKNLRECNKAFVDQILKGVMGAQGKAILDSAEAMLDSNLGGVEAWTDSVTTSNLWNQPSIMVAMLIQQFQDQAMLQYVDGIGPDGFEKATVNGSIGSVLKLPVEYYSAPAGSLSLPGYDNGLLVGEDLGIPESTINVNWLTFAPLWRRAAASLTRDAAQALKNGPLNYEAWARIAYHLVEDKKRRIDRAIAEEMLAISDEYAAVAVANEAVIAGNMVQNTGGGLLYGNTVTWYAKLIGSGTSGTPNLNPVVRARTNYTLTGQGQLTSSTINQVTVSVPASQVQGYLDGNNQIASFPGTTATFAVDYVNGRVCFNAASTVNGSTVLPTISYTYVTNFDTFSLTIPAGVEPSVYYSRLLEQIDKTAALMGSYPRFLAPNLVLGSMLAMTRVTNAQIFYNWSSPKGSTLSPSQMSSMIAERNGKAIAQHNTPWSAGDSRLLLTRRGATKYGVDTPFEIEGPFPLYDANRQIRDTKVVKGSENSVICTPQVTDQSGNVLNPVARSIYFK